jgi:hypothetical protein
MLHFEGDSDRSITHGHKRRHYKPNDEEEPIRLRRETEGKNSVDKREWE